MKLLGIVMSSVVFAISTSASEGPSLGIGSPAPEIKGLHKWIKGPELSPGDLKGKQVTVIEFWATWCGPCIESVPHLTELQMKYAGKVRVVGITQEDPGNTLELVEKFVSRMGDKLGYSVAFDKSGEVYESYMTASGQDGIPTAFVIDQQGRIAWIGHPMMDMDEVVADVLAGRHDLEKAKTLAEIDRRIASAEQVGDVNAMLKAIDEAIALMPDGLDYWMTRFHIQQDYLENESEAKRSASKLLEIAAAKPARLVDVASALVSEGDSMGYNAVVLDALNKLDGKKAADPDVLTAKFWAYSASGTHGQALEVADALTNAVSGDGGRLAYLADMLASSEGDARYADKALRAIDLAIAAEPENADYDLTKFHILNQLKDDVRGAEAAGRTLVAKAADRADLLNNFTWGLLTDEHSKGRFKGLALTAAEALEKAPGGDGWSQLDTIALARFESGDVDGAIALQKRALDKCPTDGLRATLRESLLRYEDAAGKK